MRLYLRTMWKCNLGVLIMKKLTLILFALSGLACSLNCGGTPLYHKEDIQGVCKKRETEGTVVNYFNYNLSNSQRIEDTNFPAVVAILTESGFCTATVIGNCTVLTAAHCFSNTGEPHTATIFLGDKRQNEIAWVKIHPKYRHFGVDDVAIVRFVYEIEGITPIPIDLEKPTKGEKVVLVGFGRSEEQSAGNTNKRYGENVISDMMEETIELRAPGATSLPGDSGGPILRKRSFGYTELATNTMYIKMPEGSEISYGTRLDYHHQFIMEATIDDVYFFQYPKEETQVDGQLGE